MENLGYKSGRITVTGKTRADKRFEKELKTRLVRDGKSSVDLRLQGPERYWDIDSILQARAKDILVHDPIYYLALEQFGHNGIVQ